jgi:diguanylate cyclase (GGDEF)-like protein/PAS domain S-box-containing protein
LKRQYSHTVLKDCEDTLAYILDIINEGIWDWDAISGQVVRSPGWFRMLGYKIGSFEKDVFTWENIIHPDDYAKVMEHFEAYLKGNTPTYCIQYRCRCSDGSYLWVEDRGKIVKRTPEGEVARMIGAHLDINAVKIAQDELRAQNILLQKDKAMLETLVNERTDELENLNIKLQEQLEYTNYIANHDKLTSLYNRYMFDESLEKEIKRAKRYAHPLSFIITDIDYFKNINDTYGHQTGDKILIELSGILLENIRDIDILARWGGEEFVMILPDTSNEQVLSLAEKLRSIIQTHSFEQNISLTCSFGVTTFHEHDTNDAIFARMDKALYQAKESGRNNVKSQ